MTNAKSAESAPNDDVYMAAALALGRRNLGRTAPNPAVGALILKDGVVVGRGWTAQGGRPHAEVVALKQAGALAHGATLYVTLEPCSHHGVSPPCVDAIITAGVARVVSALEDPNPRVAGEGHKRLRDAGIAVSVGAGAALARIDHMGHILRMTQHRPMVTLKLAQTADGYAAGGAHDPRLHITGAVADAFTHVQRSLHDAIMIDSGTAREDDPLMTVRLPAMENCKPLRIILDTNLSLSPRSRLATTAKSTPLLILTREETSDAAINALKQQTGADIVRMRTAGGQIDLHSALRLLSERGVTRIFCEGGPSVAESLLAHHLADEVILHKAIKPLGHKGKLALTAASVGILQDETLYRLIESRMLGGDHMTRYVKVA